MYLPFSLKTLLISLSIFLTNQYFLKVYYPENTFINGYLNDLICFPIILSSIDLFSVLLLRGRTLSKNVLILTFVVCSLSFEFLRERWVRTSTFDVWDFVMYSLGTVFYMYTRDNHLKRNNK